MTSPGFILHDCTEEGTCEVALQLLEQYDGTCPLCKEQVLPPSRFRPVGYTYPEET